MVSQGHSQSRAQQAVPGGAQPSEGEHEHPGGDVYVRVAIVLAIITAVEVVIYYLPPVRGVLIPALIVLSVAKFVAVVGYFMHLKFDSRIFTWMFAAGMAITLSVFIALAAMMFTGGYYAPVIPLPE